MIDYTRKGAEAPTGFEPVHKGFADLSLATWVRRRISFLSNLIKNSSLVHMYSLYDSPLFRLIPG